MADRTTRKSSAPDPSEPPVLPPGVRLGLPATGPGSVAGWGRRILGLVVDWVIATLVARTVLEGLGRDLGPLLVFFAMHLLLVSTIGMSIGHAVVGIAVRRLDGRPVGLAMGALRALLLTLVIPAVVFDGDRRGLHDKVAAVVVVRR
ncbi:RDD family protein [Kineococcus sp. NPDC059986]|uniref:RDD family protein n=1 Tax=Kineococcus sp. NPDC059986 TaxID=3155538 RepID=UPI00344B47F7